MICKNIAISTKEEAHLATLAIKIPRGSTKPVEVFYNKFVANNNEANRFFTASMASFIKKQLRSFAACRKNALLQNGMYSQQADAAIACINTIVLSTTHAKLVEVVDKHQEKLRMLCPSSSSAHAYWNYIIEEIIVYSHKAYIEKLAR